MIFQCVVLLIWSSFGASKKQNYISRDSKTFFCKGKFLSFDFCLLILAPLKILFVSEFRSDFKLKMAAKSFMSTCPNYGNRGRSKSLSWTKKLSKDLWRCISELNKERQSAYTFGWGGPLPFGVVRAGGKVFYQLTNTIDSVIDFLLKFSAL